MPRPQFGLGTALTAVLAGGLAIGASMPVSSQQQTQPPVAGRGVPAPQTPARPAQPARDVQQQPATGTASIDGAVVSPTTGAPVRRARVNLSAPELRGGRSTFTNDQGQFTFPGLPAGRYTMTASKAGYVNISFGAKRPGRPGTPIQLADGQKLEKIAIYLPKGSVLTGIVVDEASEPSPGTQVRAMRYVMRTGEKTLEQGGQGQTDDRGIYRIYGLQPGDYIVSAVPRNSGVSDLRQAIATEIEAMMRELGQGREGGRAGRGITEMALPGGRAGRGQPLLDRINQLQSQLQQTEQDQALSYAPVYYPGTTMPGSATSITLGIGEERAGVDFRLELVNTARIEGTVVGPDGATPQGTQVMLVPMDTGLPRIPGLGSNNSRSNQEGRFSFTNVAPGQYRLMARATIRQMEPGAAVPQGRGGPPAGRGGPGLIQQVLWASTDLPVSGQDISGLVLTLQPGMTMTGRVTFESASAQPPADLTRVRVTLTPRGQQMFEGGGVPPAQVDATGRFTIVGIPPGRYALTGAAPGGGGQRGGGAAGAPQASTGWQLKASVIAGRDTLDFPLVIEPNQNLDGALVTFTDRSQEISGMLQDSSGRPTSDLTIVIFPSDSRYWTPQSRRIMSSRPGTDGRFSFRNLPPGDYRLTAITDAEPGEWYNPDFLSQLQAPSVPITLAEGEKKVQDLRVAGR